MSYSTSSRDLHRTQISGRLKLRVKPWTRCLTLNYVLTPSNVCEMHGPLVSAVNGLRVRVRVWVRVENSSWDVCSAQPIYCTVYLGVWGYSVGQIWIFKQFFLYKRPAERSVVFLVEKCGKKVYFWSLALYRRGHDFLGHAHVAPVQKRKSLSWAQSVSRKIERKYVASFVLPSFVFSWVR
jgi:hypothetical protein